MQNNWLDMQHRGFGAYLREIEDAESCEKLNHAIACSDWTGEHVDTVLFGCKVNTDWIEKIESALPFIENAMRESRQFILRQGETVPIEKAKRVSKTSVEHLSRHSELITTVPKQDECLIPDRIYMTENIGTYVVYENRFLYMLLCYLRDFVGHRYKKITELSSAFSSNITVNKEFSNDERKISYSLTYNESSQGMDGLCDSKSDGMISRIRDILQSVALLLKTDLMREVSTAPMLRPPITRTNVFLHDPNFQAALGLYDFLVAYSQDGYEIIDRYRYSGGLSNGMKADFSALMAITSYMAYRNGGLRETLESRFLAEEKRREDEAERRKKEKLAALKSELGDIDGAALTYILALEARNTELEGISDSIHAAQSLCQQMQSKLESAMEQTHLLQTEKERLAAVLLDKNGEIRRISEQGAKALQQANQQKEEAQQRFAAELEQQKQDFLREYDILAEKYRLAMARIHALTELNGQQATEETFATKEAFAQLEAEYEAFKRFFEKQWKLTKKQIRKEQLWQSKK